MNRHVVSELAAAGAYHPDVWHALGIELLGQGEIAGLDVIKANNSHDVTKCCSAMLTLWRQRQIDASWSQLIGALKQLKLNRVAMEIEKRLKSSTEQEDDMVKLTGAMQGMKIIPTQLHDQQTKRCSLESSKGMSHLDFEKMLLVPDRLIFYRKLRNCLGPCSCIVLVVSSRKMQPMYVHIG